LSESRLARERIRAIIVALLEVILGTMTIYMGWGFIRSSSLLDSIIAPMLASPYTPQEVIAFFRSIQSSLYLIGAFILLHGIKRAMDNVLEAWVKSAKPTTSAEVPEPVTSMVRTAVVSTPSVPPLSVQLSKTEIEHGPVFECERTLRNISLLDERFQSKLEQLRKAIKERTEKLRREIESLESEKTSVEKTLEYCCRSHCRSTYRRSLLLFVHGRLAGSFSTFGDRRNVRGYSLGSYSRNDVDGVGDYHYRSQCLEGACSGGSK